MKRFLVCVHDASPAYARETRQIVGDLASTLGARLSFAVVPNWHGEWPLAAHPGYCALVRENSHELLLHGYFHQRRGSRGPVSMLTGGSDEMNGLDREETGRRIAHGQHVLADVFGTAPRSFLAPGWQRGHVRLTDDALAGLDHVLGFFSLESRTGQRVPLATWSWDCGRWAWLGHVGHGVGWLLHSLDRRAPVVAIHPRDLERGYWPAILRTIAALLDRGYEPSTLAGLLEARDAEIHS